MNNYRVILGYLLSKASPVVRVKSWDHFNQTPKSVKRFGEEHTQTLSKEQLDSIENYGFSGYKDINDTLRRGRIGDDSTESHIDNIDSAMDRNVLHRDVVVYRAIRDGGSDREHELVSRLVDIGAISCGGWNTRIRVENVGLLPRLRGFKFVERSYVSTTFRPGLFGNRDIQMRIKVPAGTHAVYLNSMHRLTGEDVAYFDGHTAEQELLLDRGLTYEVTGVQQLNQHKILVDIQVI